MNAFDTGKTFGVEIEGFGVNRDRLAAALNEAGVACYVEGYNHSTKSHWKVVTDASIRGENGRATATGFELVSPPMKGMEGLEQVKKVCEVLGKLKAKISKSCGLHVHHDASHYTVKEMKNLMKLYARMEGTLDSAMPKSRRNSANMYCKSLRGVLADKEQAFEAAETMESLRTVIGTRYLKVNIASWWKYGTVEFRQHAGTIEAEKIVNWIVFTQMLVKRAERRVKLVLTDGERFQQMTPWRSIMMELNAAKDWKNFSDELKSAIHFMCERIKHFRAAELAA